MITTMTKTKYEAIVKAGFVYKRLSKHLFLVRVYADKKRFLYHLVLPAIITIKEDV